MADAALTAVRYRETARVHGGPCGCIYTVVIQNPSRSCGTGPMFVPANLGNENGSLWVSGYDTGDKANGALGLLGCRLHSSE